MSPSDRDNANFATTQWSLVLEVGKQPGDHAQAALATLCQRYWLPLYAYVRKRTGDIHTAQDLTQDFFARLLEKEVLATASPERGRFRAFLLVAMKNFLANARDHDRALKRGGGVAPLSIDWHQGESQLNLEPVHDFTPERIFERQWALTLLDLVMEHLRNEYVVADKEAAFELLKGTLTGERQEGSYAELAGQLQTTAENARQMAHRLKKRYRELLRQEVAQTVATTDDVDDELRRLFAALGS